MISFADTNYDYETFAQMREVAKNVWERQFIDDMEERYDEYGDNAYVSERQCEIIEDMLLRYKLRRT